jgi:hypothetical protein
MLLLFMLLLTLLFMLCLVISQLGKEDMLLLPRVTLS